MEIDNIQQQIVYMRLIEKTLLETHLKHLDAGLVHLSKKNKIWYVKKTIVPSDLYAHSALHTKE